MPIRPEYLLSPTFWSLIFASLAATAVVTPLVMRLARRLGAVDSGGHRKIFVGSMPLLGGLGILLPVVGICLMGVLGPTEMFRYVGAMRTQFVVLAVGSIAIAGLGVVDDTWGLRARYKLLAQIAIAVLVVTSGEPLKSIHLPLVGVVQIGSSIALLIGILWIVGLINALNIIDGVDGLAAGVSLIAALGLLALAMIGRQTFVVLVCSGLAGSLIGFLPFNFHPAKIFLGDTGSMLLGFLLSTTTLIGSYKTETAIIVIAPLLALGFPILETLLSMARRIARGAPVFGADDRHTHHRLLSRGYSQRKVVLLLCGVSVVLTSAAIIGRLVPKDSHWEGVSLVVVTLTLIGMGWLAGYMRTVPVGQVVRRRQRNAVWNAFARYAALSLSAGQDVEKMEEVLKIGRMELGLRYLSVAVEESPMPRLATGGGQSGEGSRERMRIKSLDGEELAIEFEFNEPPDDEERRDVGACLARLFEQVRF